VTQREHLHFTHNYVRRNCSARCPGGAHYFQLEADLAAVQLQEVPTRTHEIRAEEPKESRWWDKIEEIANDVMGWARAHYLKLLIAAAVLAFGMVVGYVVMALAPLLIGAWFWKKR
jgi:hypothetical protein